MILASICEMQDVNYRQYLSGDKDSMETRTFRILGANAACRAESTKFRADCRKQQSVQMLTPRNIRVAE